MNFKRDFDFKNNSRRRNKTKLPNQFPQEFSKEFSRGNLPEKFSNFHKNNRFEDFPVTKNPIRIAREISDETVQVVSRPNQLKKYRKIFHSSFREHVHRNILRFSQLNFPRNF